MAYLKENEAEVEADYAEVMAQAEAQRIYRTERNKARFDHSNAPPPANAKIAIGRPQTRTRTQPMQILVDYNFDGDAQLLFGTLLTGGWVDLLDLEFVYFREFRH